MDWDHISTVVAACKRDMDVATASGKLPSPTGIVFVERGEERGVVAVHRRSQIRTKDDVESLVSAVRQRTPNAQAAGFVAVMPRSVWVELNGEGADGGGSVGVIHVEHLTDGARTWVSELAPGVADGWSLHRDGIFTPFPSCIDDRRYGPTKGQA